MAATHRRRWRDYSSPSGRRPVRDFFAGLSDTDVAAIVASMKEVAIEGLSAARHLRGEIYEVRAEGDRAALSRAVRSGGSSRPGSLGTRSSLKKQMQKTPDSSIRLAERRLRDWGSRARIYRS